MAANDHTSVYLYFDRHGVLIYVGMTGRGIARQKEHERDKPWWRYTHSQEIEHYPTRAAAQRREAELIAVNCPPFNTQLNGDLGQREVYLAYADSGEIVDAPKGKRIPLDIRVRMDGSLIAVTDLRYASITSGVHPAGDFDVSVAGQRAKDVQLKRLGSALVVKLSVRNPERVASGTLMYRINAGGMDVKRIDFAA